MDMEHWSGFSDVELNSLKQQGRGRRNARRSRGQPLNQGTRKVVYPIGRVGNNSTNANSESLPSGPFFSRETSSIDSDAATIDMKKNVDVEKPASNDVEIDTVSTESSGDSGIALTESPPTSLEEMQKQQKLIEELNKKKKAMLQETLQQRYKQTQQESKTLQIVNQELGKLDNMISSEIGILRERIEEANRQYNAARKRFERAEKEYVEAKVALHHSTEHKELLAEHLCAVIQENEIRKAKKLEELMVKLNITAGDEEGSIAPKALLYQRTPTPRYEHWPQSPARKIDTVTGYQPEKDTGNSQTLITAVTKVDIPHNDSTVTTNGSGDPPDSSHDPVGSLHDLDDSLKTSQRCSHDPDNGLCDQKNIDTSVNDNSKTTDSATDSIRDSQDLNSQANS